MIITDLLDLLTTGSVATKGTNLFGGDQMPDTPDAAVMVRPYGGFPQTLAFGATAGAVVLETARVQVEVRDLTYPLARTTMEKVFQVLHNMQPRTINGVAYNWIHAVQPEPMPLGKDGSQRSRLTMNFEVLKSHSTG